MTTPQPQPRRHAAGGWRRALVGVLVGAGFGAWVTRVVPADRGWPPERPDGLRAGVRDVASSWRGRAR